MPRKSKTIASFLLIGTLVLLSGCGCRPEPEDAYRVKLEVWGFVDDGDNLRSIFANYKKISKHISDISYRKLSTDTYKKELIEALATGQGPDIFMIHDNWRPSFEDKTVPAPDSIINEQKFRNDFVDVCADELLSQGKVWAIPLSVDSLGLYYNKTLFNAAGITSPPRDWEEFVEDVKILTVEEEGRITQSGVALGTAYNINRSTDVLNLLMLQAGTPMVEDSHNKATFNTSVSRGGQSYAPGEKALDFYTQFSRLGSRAYSWNRDMHYSIDAFSENTVAMMLNYSWHIGTIREKAPKLDFAIAPVPQFPDGPKVNYPNYWAYAVSKNKIIPSNAIGVTNDRRVEEAWKFLKFLAAKPDGPWNTDDSLGSLGSVIDPYYDPAAEYVQNSGKPAARRDLIEKQKTDPWLGVFAADNLIAKSWYQKDPDATEAIFAEMIDQVNRGEKSVHDAIGLATVRVSQMMGK